MTDTHGWHADELARYVGRRIVKIRPLNDVEMASEAWDGYDIGQTVVLIMDDGSALISQSDPEGNGPGYLQTAHLIP